MNSRINLILGAAVALALGGFVAAFAVTFR